MNPIDLLYNSFEANSIIWIIISVGLGAVITATIQFIFEHNLEGWQRRRATKKAIHKYGYSITLSAYNLYEKINDILGMKGGMSIGDFEKKSHVDIVEDYSLLNVLYLFGSFFGWGRIFEKESFSEFSELPLKRQLEGFSSVGRIYLKKKILPVPDNEILLFLLSGIVRGKFYRNMIFTYIYYSIFNGIIFNLTWKGESFTSAIPSLALGSIGDLMIKEQEGNRSILNFVEFARNYSTDELFKKSFSYLINMTSELDMSQPNRKLNTLIILYESLKLLTQFQGGILDPSKLDELRFAHYLSSEALAYLEEIRKDIGFSRRKLVLYIFYLFLPKSWRNLRL